MLGMRTQVQLLVHTAPELDVELNVFRCRADILDTNMLHALSTEVVRFIREIAFGGGGGFVE